MVRTYNWNPSTQSSIKITDRPRQGNEDEYQNDEKNRWSSMRINKSSAIVRQKMNDNRNFSLHSNTSSSEHNLPSLMKVGSLNESNSYPPENSFNQRLSYDPLPNLERINPNLDRSNPNMERTNPHLCEPIYQLPTDIEEGKTFIVGMKACLINGSIYYKPIPVQQPSFASNHQQPSRSDLQGHSSQESFNYDDAPRQPKETFSYVSRQMANNTYNPPVNNSFDKSMSHNNHPSTSMPLKYPIDKELFSVNNPFTRKLMQAYESKMTQAQFNNMSDKERHKFELLEQIEDNKRRKILEKAKEWEEDERQRIKDEIFFEKQRRAIAEEEEKSRVKIEQIQINAKAMADRAFNVSLQQKSNSLRVSDNGTNQSYGRDNVRDGRRNGSTNSNKSDSLSYDSNQDTNGRQGEDFQSRPNSSVPKKPEWWEKKKNAQSPPRATSPPIPAIRNANNKNNSSNDPFSTNDPFNTNNSFTDERNNNNVGRNDKSRRQDVSSGTPSNRSINLSATAESLQKELRQVREQSRG